MKHTCPFCDEENVDYLTIMDGEEVHWRLIASRYPISDAGHLLLIPFHSDAGSRHVGGFYDLNDSDYWSFQVVFIFIYKMLCDVGKSFNVLINCGEAAGQTIPHLHIHFILREEGDGIDYDFGGNGIVFFDAQCPDLAACVDDTLDLFWEKFKQTWEERQGKAFNILTSVGKPAGQVEGLTSVRVVDRCSSDRVRGFYRKDGTPKTEITPEKLTKLRRLLPNEN